MFASKIAALLAVATAVAALPSGLLVRGGGGVCSTGALNCCDQIQPSSSYNSADQGGTLPIIPINLQGLAVPIGINCSPITVIGAGSAGSCSQQSACCEDTDGEFGINCSPTSTNV